MKELFIKLRWFDTYHKTLEDVRIKTYSGAIVSITSIVIMLILFSIELIDYITPTVTEELLVDTSRSPHMQIHLDIVIPHITCEYLSIDAFDVSGDHHLNIEQNINKVSVPNRDTHLPTETVLIPEVTSQLKLQELENKTACGSCYGAALDPKACCNSCVDVLQAYRNRRWSLPTNLDSIEQCKNEQTNANTSKFSSAGCHMFGYFTVNRVGGSFHIVPGKSVTIPMVHAHVHDIKPFSIRQFNVSHHINHLTFDSSTSNISDNNALGNTNAIAAKGATMFRYYLKIVPVAYANMDASYIFATKYSVTRYEKALAADFLEEDMPGIFFNYELTPIMVKYKQKQRPFGHFVTNLCAIIGGVYSVAGLIDKLLFHSTRFIREKIMLGKFQ